MKSTKTGIIDLFSSLISITAMPPQAVLPSLHWEAENAASDALCPAGADK